MFFLAKEVAKHLNSQDKDLDGFLNIFSLGEDLNLKIREFVKDFTSKSWIDGVSNEVENFQVLDEIQSEASDEDTSASDVSHAELTDEYCDSESE